MIPEMALMCLTLNIYHEARSESAAGQAAVALVTLNRAQRDPSRVCAEVFRPYQFSWTLSPKRITEPRAWQRAKEVARAVWTMQDFTEGATHFHADYVSPAWADAKVRVGQCGRHIFYRRK